MVMTANVTGKKIQIAIFQNFVSFFISVKTITNPVNEPQGIIAPASASNSK